MIRSLHLVVVLVLIGAAVQSESLQAAGDAKPPAVSQVTSESLPNIVLILADDLGYGDVGCYGSLKLQTPNIDRLAQAGLRFTDGHAAAATCTPSRYSLLTGEYAWRKKGTGILPGDAALVIEPGRDTLPGVLRKAGYRTGVVGKWHLGLGTGNVDWNAEIKPCPLDIGFDESFIMAATGDRVPCVYVQDRHVVGLDPSDPIQVSYKQNFPGEPTGQANPELLRVHPSHGHHQSIVNGISRIGFMKGGRAALWRDEDMSDTFLAQAQQFVERHQSERFFLFYATHEPHVPRVPHPRFAGKSGLGPRGDVIVQMDDAVGQLLDTLDRLKLTEQTLVVLTSDNGPVLDDGYKDQARELNGDHRPSGPYRGNKYSAFEAGTRVPFIVRWPGHVHPGVSQALVSQIDLLASCAALTGQAVNRESALDSQDHLAALLGKSASGRTTLVQQANVLALRDGNWKLISPGQGPRRNANTGIETGNAPRPQLFDLQEDPAETTNLAEQHPDIVAELMRKLEAIKAQTTAP